MKSQTAEENTSHSQAGNARGTDESVNPLYILGGIGLGIPALAMISLIGLNPAIQEGTLTTITTFVVIMAFAVAALFEIKRLADQPSDKDH